MKRKKTKILAVLMACILIFGMMPSSAFADAASQSGDIVILFTGDVHGQAEENLGYAGVAAYKKDMQAKNPYVTLVDAGDSVSGSLLSSVSKGVYSVEAMNLVGYTAAVPGVHDFDFGASYLGGTLAPKANFFYSSCNFVMKSTGIAVFRPYIMEFYGDKKVAYVGISDPQTAEKSAVSFGDTFSFLNGGNGAELYAAVQDAVTEARMAGADYVIAVGHLTADRTSPYSAQAVIQNTTGITAFIQGGNHAAVNGEKVTNLTGDTVLLSCAGSGLKNIGVLKIKENQTLEAQMVGNYSYRDMTVQDRLDTLEASYNASLSKNFAMTASRLEATSSGGARTIDKKETNLGDLVADAYKAATGADIALVESKDIRASLALGNITYKDVLKVLPDEKPVSVALISGTDIMDALEMSARLYPNANGGFFQVSGLTYDIQETVIPSVTLDGFGGFRGISGEYRVTNVMINGRPLDLFSSYKVAGAETLLNGSTGYTMFKNGTMLESGAVIDSQAVISYLSGTLNGTVGGHYAKSQGRVDSIRLVRQSELALEVDDMVKEQLKEYQDRIAELEKQLLQKQIEDLEIQASSKYGKSSGKRYITVSWKVSEEIDGLKYQVYKSTKKSSGYSKVTSTGSLSYKNTSSLKKGTTYYYKVRGYKSIGGKTYYSAWSNVTSKKVTS